jgi:hypothetical protein
MDGVRYGVRQATKEQATDAQGLYQVPAAEARALSIMTGFGLGTATVDATLIPDGNAGCPFDRLEMDVSVPFTPIIGFVPMPANISATFSMMSEAQR